MEQEAQKAWDHYQSGLLRELYFSADNHEAVLECDSAEDARKTTLRTAVGACQPDRLPGDSTDGVFGVRSAVWSAIEAQIKPARNPFWSSAGLSDSGEPLGT